MLKGLLKAKWQHPDAEVRRRALEELPAGESEILEQMVREDEAPSVRRLGIRRCTDLALIAERAAEDPDASVREHAEKRYRQLLAGRVDGAPPLAERVEILARTEDQALLEHLVREAVEVELRERALAKVTRLPVLRDVTLNDADVSLRLRALERIEDESTLERICQRSRKTDKRVSRGAREKLDALVAGRERPLRAAAECRQICTAAEHLGRDEHWERDRTRLDDLDRRWGALEDEHRAPHEARFDAARSAFVEALEAHLRTVPPIRAAKQATIEAVEALLREPPAERPAGEDPAASLEAAARTARSDWQHIATLAGDEEDALAARFDRACSAVEGRARELRCAAVLRSVRDDSDKLLKRKGVIGERDVKALERRREAAGSTAGSAPLEKLARRLDAIHGALRDRVREQVTQKAGALETLPGRLDQLKRAVSDGDASTAVPLHDAIESDLDALAAMGTSRERLESLRSGFKALTPEVGVMRAWDRFGARQARERLCETMEAMIGAGEHPEEIARRIREARAEWKRLAERNPDVNQSLWRRFDAAARKAHEPCEAHFEQLAAARKANLEKRRGVADRLEAFLAEADWSAMDWKAAVRFRREALAEWQGATPIDRKPARALDKRWRAGLDAMEVHLAAERERCQKDRERLIEQATALAEMADARRAVDECKALQRQWTTTVPASRGRENDLWRRFRGACDAVFERRQAAFDEQRDRSRANVEQRQALCQRAEALLATDQPGIDEAARELHRIQGEWKQLGPVPKRDGAAVEARFVKAARSFREHRQALAVAARRAELVLLERKAAICHEAEIAASGPPLDALRARLGALEPLADAEQEAAIGERFQRACQGAGDGAGDGEDAAREARENLCLRMEILAGVDSPPEHAQARMAYQVERLASALSSRQGADSDTLESLVRAWCLSGPAPAAVAVALESRFARARGGVDQAASDS